MPFLNSISSTTKVSLLMVFFTWLSYSLLSAQIDQSVIPFLNSKPTIDGDLSEWKWEAFSEGVWDMDRVKKCSWYEPKRNRLKIEQDEDSTQKDLSAQYYVAWDGINLFFGAEVRDNIHDVTERNHEPKRWYYKDAIALFTEFPRDSISEFFAEGDHAFCFVIDTAYPEYGAWWRHGTATSAYIEERLKQKDCEYKIIMNPWNESGADFILEAKIDLTALVLDKYQRASVLQGANVGMMIVHCDPDGGEYGGHMMIYGKGDDDITWKIMELEKKDD